MGGGDYEVMARARSPDRDKAFEIWKNSNGSIKLKDIATELNLPDSRIRKWKNEDKWEEKVKGTFLIDKGNVPFTRNKRGAPKGNKNSVGHASSTPIGNTHAMKHGFFAKIFPNDPETKSIVESIDIMSPIEMLWQNIVIQYTAIARAQRIMFVRNQDDMTKELKRQKDSDTSQEIEYELQFAWDKQASFMQAQSRAMSTLQGMITKYDELMQKDLSTEEQQLRINKLKAEIAKLTGSDDSEDDNSNNFLDALSGKVKEVWNDE